MYWGPQTMLSFQHRPNLRFIKGIFVKVLCIIVGFLSNYGDVIMKLQLAIYLYILYTQTSNDITRCNSGAVNCIFTKSVCLYHAVTLTNVEPQLPLFRPLSMEIFNCLNGPDTISTN